MRYSGRTGTVLTLDENNKIQVINVTYTGSDDGWVAVDSGLKEGDRVIVAAMSKQGTPAGGSAFSPQAGGGRRGPGF